MEGSGIKLFGKKISCNNKITNLPVLSSASDDAHLEKNCLEEERTNRQHSQEDPLRQRKQENVNPNTPITEDTDTEFDATNSQPKSLKKPDKILPCPRCNSMDTKFCYYNNYNIKQPRHFCKSCQRYWTAGGTMRTMPVGAGRRKNKNPAATQIEFAFNFDKRNEDDCSSGSTVTTSNSVVEQTQDTNGFHSHHWNYIPWNSMPIYPSPYWNYIPFLPLSSPTQNDINSFNLGKHSRNEEFVGSQESKKHKNSVLTPKTLRIDDPDEAAMSSIWSTLGIKNDDISTRGIFKAFQTKSDENKKHSVSNNSPVLQANPAAFSRSLCFQERA